MPKYDPPEIIRREKFVVDHSEVDGYGNLIVTSKKGNEYKVSAKRPQLFDEFQPDIEVVVGYANFMNHDYIAEVTPSGQLVSTNTPVKDEKPKPTVAPPTNPPTSRIAGEERGMWWKEVGENFRKGLFDKDDGKNGTMLWHAYQAQMFASLEITFEKKKG